MVLVFLTILVVLFSSYTIHNLFVNPHPNVLDFIFLVCYRSKGYVIKAHKNQKGISMLLSRLLIKGVLIKVLAIFKEVNFSSFR